VGNRKRTQPRRFPAFVVIAAVALGAIAVPATAGAKGYRYPLKGPHNYGDLSDTGFGVKRPDGSIHTGQDILANCGTPIVAVHQAHVIQASKQEGYGNYLVLQGVGSRFAFVYAHMKGRARVGKGRTVRAGQRVGSVGNTGTDSRVCHLHFELWKGRWFAGGHRINPLPHLRQWDKNSGGPETQPQHRSRFYSAAD
jgi:murein DD-endopeptidase MepM/ murein hydrolase activator NlpD